MRIDKWLWATRFYKTRSLAARAIEAGRVRINGERVKPAKEVAADDLIACEEDGLVRTVRVVRVSDTRTSALIAQTCYVETPESLQLRMKEAERRRLFREPAEGQKGRPGKRELRLLRRIRDG